MTHAVSVELARLVVGGMCSKSVTPTVWDGRREKLVRVETIVAAMQRLGLVCVFTTVPKMKKFAKTKMTYVCVHRTATAVVSKRRALVPQRSPYATKARVACVNLEQVAAKISRMSRSARTIAWAGKQGLVL